MSLKELKNSKEWRYAICEARVGIYVRLAAMPRLMRDLCLQEMIEDSITRCARIISGEKKVKD